MLTAQEARSLPIVSSKEQEKEFEIYFEKRIKEESVNKSNTALFYGTEEQVKKVKNAGFKVICIKPDSYMAIW